MPDDIGDFLEDAANQLQAMRKQSGREKTIIVHPQIGQNVDEARKISEDWSYREQKQVDDNLKRILEGKLR